MSAYDNHQRLRSKAVRQLQKKKYDEAITTVSQGAVSMLEAKEQGSGCDLGCYLVDIYEQAGRQCGPQERETLAKIISLAQNDFWRKKVIDSAVKWSVRSSRNPAGDSYLRLAIAETLTKESSFYLSEVHFLAACVPPPSTSTSDAPEHAPKAYALMMVDWLQAFAAESAQQPGETRSADVLERIECGRFALRGLMPLLSLKAHQAARGFLSIFVSRITSKHPTLLIPVTPNPKPYSAPPGVESAPSPPQGLQLYVTGNPDLNFGQMALALSLHALGAKKSSGRVHESLKKAWVGLVRQYESEAEDFHENGVADTIPPISKDTFDMAPSRPQGNFMQDMLSSLMGGGAGGQGQIAGGATGEPAPVQPLHIKQAPQPTAKAQESSKEIEGAGQGQAIEAPEEDDLD